MVVFAEQIGLPLPAMIWLPAAGALSAMGQFSPLLGTAITVIACLMADAIWFYLGRFHGAKVLGLLCRISLKPDSCVRRTRNIFTRYGLRGLLVAKFAPGLSTVTPPLAGMGGIGIRRFLLVDAAGSLLYGTCFISLGHFFSKQIEQIGAAITGIGSNALALLVCAAGLYITYKYWQRRRLLNLLRAVRITVAELRQKLNAGEPPLIFDLRSNAELKSVPLVFRGAVHMEMNKIISQSHTITSDQDIVVYCSCPDEITSARLTLSLQQKGFTRIRPLLGGIEAWRKDDHPTEIWRVTKGALKSA